MHNFISLLKIQILGFLSGNANKKRSAGKRLGKYGVVIILAAAFIYLGYTYAYMFGETLAPMGQIGKLLPLMIGISALITFFFSFYGTTNILYGFKDYELLVSLPIKKSTVVMSKLFTLVFTGFIETICILIPSFFVYSKYNYGIEILTVIYSLVIAFFSPFLMTAFAVIVGVIISLISSLFRKKNLINGLLLVAFMVAILVFSFGMGISSETGNFGSLEKLYFLFPIVVKGISEFKYLALFILINVLPFALIFFLVVITYTRVNAILSAKRTLKNFKLKSYSQGSFFGSLLRKEFKRLFSSPMYFMNTFIGVIIGFVSTIAVPIIFAKIEDGALLPIFRELIIFAPSLFAFSYMLSPTTACSISIEGKSFWITLTSPIPINKAFNAKLILEFIMNLPVALLSTVVASIVLKLDFSVALLLILCALLIATFGGVLGLFFNILFPKLNWSNENQAIKQGLALFLIMVVSFVFAGLFILLGIKVQMNLILRFIVYDFVLLLLCVIVYLLIMLKGEEWLKKKI